MGGRVTPNPVPFEWVLHMNTVGMYKHMECPHYTECMELAARAKWDQFHCKNCVLADGCLDTDLS